MSETKNLPGFRALGLSPGLLKTLDRLGFKSPTPIQRDAIPHVLKGEDLIGIAQTGTGKTLAFGIPMAEHLPQGRTALVLAPTRELAEQINVTLTSIGLKSVLIVGGASMNRQVAELRARPAVVVATPGRLLDHMGQKTVDLRRAATVVLDEADRMLDMGFAPAIKQILAATPKDRQTLLFSATMPKEISELANQFLSHPTRIEVARAGTAVSAIEQELVLVPHAEKQLALKQLLAEHPGSVLVFARTRHGARKLAKSVRSEGHSATEIHSDRTLAQRRAALDGFKKGTYRVLVATDIAARGIDVRGISVVINYDVPENPEDYVHRIGRTGRAGATGRAITLATPEQHKDIRDIEKLLQSKLRVAPARM